MPQVFTVTTDVIIYPLSATAPSCVMVHLLNWCYLHLSENHLSLNICLRSAFGKNQIRSRPSYQGRQHPSITHRCAKKQPSSAGTTILLGGPGHRPGPHQLQGRPPLGNSIFCRVPNPFLPKAQATSVEKRCWLAPLNYIPTIASLSFPFLHQESGHTCPPQSAAMRMNSSNGGYSAECWLHARRAS